MARDAARRLKRGLGWSITLGGTCLLMADLSAAATPFFHGVVDAIMKAMA
ncbi:hypothetical protein [Paraburkholderia sp.]|jgi:hypothetical protein